MKITEIHPFLVDGGWRNWLFLEVETDVGINGVGECSLEGREYSVEGAIKDLSRSVLGEDPRKIRSAIHKMTRHGYWEAGPVISSAVGGIEMALWDILGKSLDVPVSTLLGGRVRDSVRAYANAWYFGAETAEDFAERATTVVESGFTALKFDPFGSHEYVLSASAAGEAFDRVQAVRDAAGSDVDLMIEGHGRFGLETAIRFARKLEAVDSILFFEEPIVPGDPASEARMASSTSVPIAIGERWYSAREAMHAIRGNAATVAQPDVIHIGGIGALHQVALACDASNIAVAPHNASGPVATAATLQVAAVIPNLLIQEVFAPWDVAWRDEIAVPAPEIQSGSVVLSDLPGLGITLNPREIEERSFTAKDLNLFEDSSILANDIDRDAREVSQ